MIVRLRFGRAGWFFVVRMRWRRLREELVRVVLAIALELEILFNLFDPAVALQFRLRRVVERTLDAP
eukprot:1895079-Pleurochrysis_carterae.AAC.2